MDFKMFSGRLKKHVAAMSKDVQFLFVADVDRESLWETYLESFPPDKNKIFRERREFDCSACRQFVKGLGNVVAIKGNRLVSVWDFDAGDEMYQGVVDALAAKVKACPVRDVFASDSRSFGIEKNNEILDGGDVATWYHMHGTVSDSVKVFRKDEIGTVMGRMRDSRNVLERSFRELTQDSVETVLELIAQKSLYKGEEWSEVLKKFLAMHKAFWAVSSDEERAIHCWKASMEAGDAISRIKNHSMGVLLTDISEGMDLNEAVRRYEKIVAPSNYKRPKAIYTKKMLEQARKTVEDLGFSASLGRRFARLEDITVNNILFANRDAARAMAGDVFAEMAEELPDRPRNLDKIEEVPIETFVRDILPTAKDVEVLLENSHASNMVSLIAPIDKEAPTMFKWNNGFSWAYSGNITDSMKERVKALGGKVEGDLRFSIRWNDDGDNLDDLDAHCHEPGGNHIYFSNKGIVHRSSGMLDVDIITPESQTKDGVAVENIVWSDRHRMPKGVYKLLVHCYSKRGGKSGFTAEVEFDGQIHSFSYSKPLRQGQNVQVAEVVLDEKGQFSITEKIPSSLASREVWGLTSNSFCPVSAMMYSPNYWDEQDGIGHRHYMFLLKGCKNPDRPNGFFNEFLKEDLMKHKRVFEALGSKMAVAESDDQLSGLGFSSTKRGSLVCRVRGNFTRVIRLVF